MSTKKNSMQQCMRQWAGQGLGICPGTAHSLIRSSAFGHTACLMTNYYLYVNNQSALQDLFYSEKNAGDMSEEDVALIWAAAASAMSQKSRHGKLKVLLNSDLRYSSWSWPATLITDGQGHSVLPHVAVLAMRRTLTPGKNIMCDERLKKKLTVPQTIWHAYTWELLKWWVDTGNAPEHLQVLCLEHDLSL